MAYIRKTRDEWEIQANYGYGHGWECVNTETTWKDAKRSIAEYRANEYAPFRIVKKRVKLTQWSPDTNNARQYIDTPCIRYVLPL